MNCSSQYFKETKFVEWSFPKIKDCYLNAAENIGERIWEGQGQAGFILLILFVVFAVFLYRRFTK